MTIEELFGKVIADEALKESLMTAVEEGNIADWAKAEGVEATQEELLSYIKTAAKSHSATLTDEELESVAGGRSYGNFITYMADCCNKE